MNPIRVIRGSSEHRKRGSVIPRWTEWLESSEHSLRFRRLVKESFRNLFDPKACFLADGHETGSGDCVELRRCCPIEMAQFFSEGKIPESSVDSVRAHDLEVKIIQSFEFEASSEMQLPNPACTSMSLSPRLPSLFFRSFACLSAGARSIMAANVKTGNSLGKNSKKHLTARLLYNRSRCCVQRL